MWSMVGGGKSERDNGQKCGPHFWNNLFGKMNFHFRGDMAILSRWRLRMRQSGTREGTLPLLYLTELHSFGIVVGKSLCNICFARFAFLTMVHG